MIEAPSDGEHYRLTKELFRQAALCRQGFYDARPGGRLRHTFWQRRVRTLVTSCVDQLLHRETDIDSVIDVGCGMGDFTIEMAERYPVLSDVWGIDFSLEALAIAAGRKQIQRPFFCAADIRHLPCGDNRFGLTMCINVLHHVLPNDLGQVLSELTRITKRYLVLEIKNQQNFYYKQIHFRAAEGVGRIQVFPSSIPLCTRILQTHNFRLEAVKGLFLFTRLSPLLVLLYKKKGG